MHVQITTALPGRVQAPPRRPLASPVRGRRPARSRLLGSEHELLEALHADPRFAAQSRTTRRALEHACFFWADGHGSFTAQVRRWAEAIDAHPDTLRVGMRAAVVCGLLERSAFYGARGRQGANEYRLAVVPAGRRGQPVATPEKDVNKGRAKTLPRNVRTLGGDGDDRRPRGVPPVIDHRTAKPPSECSATPPVGAGELWWSASDTPKPLPVPRCAGRPTPWRVTPSPEEKADRVEAALRAHCSVVRPRTRPGHVASFEVSCPLGGRHAHGDGHPSAAVSVTDDGTIKLACGVCGFGRDADYWRDAMIALGLPLPLAFADGYEIDRSAIPPRRAKSKGQRAGGRAARRSLVIAARVRP